MPKSYGPGHREKKYGKNHQLSEDRYAWVHTESGKFMILVGQDNGHGSDVVLFSPRPGTIPDFTASLTNLTKAELDALEELFVTAFEWARPVVDRRDKEAEDARNAGDDSFTRIYRPLPTVVYRKRPEPEHSEGVRLGSEGVPESSGGGRPHSAGGVRTTGSELAEPDEGDGGSEDDCTQTD